MTRPQKKSRRKQDSNSRSSALETDTLTTRPRRRFCHTETEIADHTFSLTKSPYTVTRPTCPSADPKLQRAGQGSHWNVTFFESPVWLDPGKNPVAQQASGGGGGGGGGRLETGIFMWASKFQKLQARWASEYCSFFVPVNAGHCSAIDSSSLWA